MKYFLTLLFLAVAAPTGVLLHTADACAEEPLTPLADIFAGKDTVKFLACAEYPDDDSYEATVKACREKMPGSYLILNANGKGYLVTDDDERHKARFTWSGEPGAGEISVIRGERELGYVFYRNKYANGYAGAVSDLPVALEKE